MRGLSAQLFLALFLLVGFFVLIPNFLSPAYAFWECLDSSQCTKDATCLAQSPEYPICQTDYTGCTLIPLSCQGQCCKEVNPAPSTFQCTDQGGLQFSCFNSCPTNWVSASQNPNTSCAASGQTCCWYNPPPAPNCVATDCNGVDCSASGQVCTITTNPCSCVTPTPTCSSSNCGACSNCSTCIANTACGWSNTSGCQAGTASCPAGYTDWHWDSCSTNVCQPAPPPPAPTPTCTYNRTYNQCCGDNLSRSVDEYTDSSGNVCLTNVGTCSQADPTCAPTDTQKPVCDSFSLSSTSVIQGDNVTIRAVASDNIRVETLKLLKAGTEFISFTNSSVDTPFGITYGYDTSTLTPGTYTFSANAADPSNNTMVGTASNCQGTLTVTIPVCPKPAGLAPTGTINSCSNSITLRWSPAAGVQSYNLRLDDGVNDVKDPQNSPGCTPHAVCINGLSPSTTSMTVRIVPGRSYNWWVDAIPVDANRCQIGSTSATFNTVCTSAVTGTASCSGTNSQIVWSWGACGTGSYTNLRLTDLTSSQFQNFTPSSSQSSFTSANLQANHNYSLRVTDNSNNFCTSSPYMASNCAPTTVGTCTLTASPSSATSPTSVSLSVDPQRISPPLSTMPGSKMSQWDLNGDGSFEKTDTLLNQTAFAQSSTTYQFRVIDGAKSPGQQGYILSGPCSAPVTIGGGVPPPPPATGCSLSINGTPYPGSPIVSYRSTITISASAPSLFTLTLPNDTRDTYNGSASKLFDLSNVGPGTYTVDLNNTLWGGSCNISQTVTAQPSSSDCKVQDSATIITYAFNDPNYDSAAWPAYTFTSNNTPFPQTTYYPHGLSSSCSGPAQCNDNNPCTYDACVGNTDGEGNITNGFCQNSPAPDRTQCRTRNPNCWGWGYHIWNFRECTDPLPVCQAGICMSQSDANSNIKRCSTPNDPICKDNNPCTEDKCNLWDDGDGNIQGWCSNNITTGASCQSGGRNGYCISSGQCSTYACKSDADCNDNNSCTRNDQCVGYYNSGCGDAGEGSSSCWQEILGTCQSTNTPSAVCQGSATDPQKLCSPESPSQCNIDYVKCTSPSLNNQYCCGTTNIQQINGGTCSLTPFPNWWVGTWSPNLPPKAGVVIHAKGDQCNLDYTNITGSDGRADFSNLPATVGRSSTQKSRVNWTIQADIPVNDKFTRGTCYRVGRSGTYPDSVKTATSNTNQAQCGPLAIPVSCNSDGCGVMSTGFATFGFNKPSTPWIQTTGGDVHSNTRINTPGGP